MAKRGIIIPQDNSSDFDEENYELKTVKDYFIEYLFPDAIIYGMSYEEFWNKDPELFFSYRFSFIKKTEIENQENNFMAWLIGAYNLKALQTALASAFGDKKTVIPEYPKQPIDIYGNGEDKVVQTEQLYLKRKDFWSHFKERSRRK